MTIRKSFLPLVLCVMAFSFSTQAQTSERRQTNPDTQAQEQPASLPPNATSIDVVANEIGLLRKSVQTLTARLREVSESLRAPAAKPGDEKQNPISVALDLLSRAEQRAEILRKQLFELLEKETALRNRLVQLDEDLRPESIERTLSLTGSTRVAELRETRRRLLDNERKGYEILLNQTSQSRLKLEDDVRQADAMVLRLRLRLFPLIDKEIDKIEPK